MFQYLMKKVKDTRCMSALLFMLLLLYPVGVTSASLLGYQFTLFNELIYAALMALTAVYVLVLSGGTEADTYSKVLPLVAPISLITSFYFMLDVMSPWIVVIMAICVVSCILLSWKCSKPKVLRVISLTLVALMIVPVGFLGFIALVFGGIGKNTVVQSISSPMGTYYAELIDSDQGALGGNTLVDVHHSKRINALLFQIEKKPQRVYHGEWGEFEDIEIYWKDDNCLVINSKEYDVN